MIHYTIISIFYFMTYYYVLNDMFDAYSLVILAMIFFQFFSVKNSVYILALGIFVPFFDSIPILGNESLTLQRAALIPFLIQITNKSRIRRFNMNNNNVFNLLISAILFVAIFNVLQVNFDIANHKSFTPIRLLGYTADIVTVLFFFYYIFTRLDENSIKKIFDIFLFIIILEGISILLLIAYNPQYLYSSLGHEFRVTTIERNPFFGTRNSWGLLFGLSFLITFLRFQMERIKKLDWLNILTMIVSIMVVTLSLSRRAYFLIVIGITFILLYQRKFKPFLITGSIIGILSMLPLDFILLRLESILQAKSFEDLRYASSGQLYFEATKQFLNNITVIPNALSGFTYTRNFSESLWSGILYRQGVLGLFFQFFLLFKIFTRYKINPEKLDINLGIFVLIMKLIAFVFFIMGFITTTCYFINYIGLIQQIGIMALFLFFYTELMLYNYGNNK